MSKSYGNTIGLTEAPSSIIAKVSAMSTGGQRIRQSDGGDAELCPVGDLHTVFGAPGQFAEIQQGCKIASIRCESCKAKATESLVAVIQPIYEKRMQMEANIEQTWEMLRAQSAKAARRAEQTMLEVREIFDLSHELGAVKRYFGASAEELQNARDLSARAELRELPPDEQAKELREFWRGNLVPREVQLTQEGQRTFATLERELEEPLITAKKKRVFVTAAVEVDEAWNFLVPAKSYEVWTLLGWDRNLWLEDFILPQKVFSQPFAQAKKCLKKDEKIPVKLRRDGERFLLSIHGSEPVDVTDLRSNYAPLQ